MNKGQRAWKMWYSQNCFKTSFEEEVLMLPLILEKYFKMQTSWERSLWGNEEVTEFTYNDRKWHSQAVPQAMHNDNLKVYYRCKEVINMDCRKEGPKPSSVRYSPTMKGNSYKNIILLWEVPLSTRAHFA